MLMLWPASALATIPASKEQILCSRSNLAIGRIVDAESADCRLSARGDKACWERKIAFSFLLESALKGFEKITPGAVLKGNALFQNDLPMKVGTKTFAMNEAWGQFSLPATGKPATSAEARRELKGRRFIFSLDRDNSPSATGAVFSIDDLDWIEKVIADPRCTPSTSVWHLNGT
jgi:hypothetical protein